MTPVPTLVSGDIIILAGTPSFSGATMNVFLEDVSYADAASRRIAETTIPDVSHAPASGGNTSIRFELQPAAGAPPIDQGHDYAVRVWVDMDSDGKPGPGDLYSGQSYPVLTRGFTGTTSIRLGGTRIQDEHAP